MPTLIKQLLAAGAFAFAAGALCAAPAALAATSADKPAKAEKSKTSRVKAAKKTKEIHPKVVDVLDQNDPEFAEPDIANTVTTDFDCELGNKVTIYKNEGDETSIALRWKKRLHRLTRVGTTTGAHRFENKLFGLTWIGIPAKGMLLDSKQNRQLANECKNAEQAKSAQQETPSAPGQPAA